MYVTRKKGGRESGGRGCETGREREKGGKEKRKREGKEKKEKDERKRKKRKLPGNPNPVSHLRITARVAMMRMAMMRMAMMRMAMSIILFTLDNSVLVPFLLFSSFFSAGWLGPTTCSACEYMHAPYLIYLSV